MKSLSQFLSEQLVLEERYVTFDNVAYPKDGWCVIMAGGGGSGKSTSF